MDNLLNTSRLKIWCVVVTSSSGLGAVVWRIWSIWEWTAAQQQRFDVVQSLQTRSDTKQHWSKDDDGGLVTILSIASHHNRRDTLQYCCERSIWPYQNSIVLLHPDCDTRTQAADTDDADDQHRETIADIKSRTCTHTYCSSLLLSTLKTVSTALNRNKHPSYAGTNDPLRTCLKKKKTHHTMSLLLSNT